MIATSKPAKILHNLIQHHIAIYQIGICLEVSGCKIKHHDEFVLLQKSPTLNPSHTEEGTYKLIQKFIVQFSKSGHFIHQLHAKRSGFASIECMMSSLSTTIKDNNTRLDLPLGSHLLLKLTNIAIQFVYRRPKSSKYFCNFCLRVSCQDVTVLDAISSFHERDLGQGGVGEKTPCAAGRSRGVRFWPKTHISSSGIAASEIYYLLSSSSRI